MRFSPFLCCSIATFASPSNCSKSVRKERIFQLSERHTHVRTSPSLPECKCGERSPNIARATDKSLLVRCVSLSTPFSSTREGEREREGEERCGLFAKLSTAAGNRRKKEKGEPDDSFRGRERSASFCKSLQWISDLKACPIVHTRTLTCTCNFKGFRNWIGNRTLQTAQSLPFHPFILLIPECVW